MVLQSPAWQSPALAMWRSTAGHSTKGAGCVGVHRSMRAVQHRRHPGWVLTEQASPSTATLTHDPRPCKDQASAPPSYCSAISLWVQAHTDRKLSTCGPGSHPL